MRSMRVLSMASTVLIGALVFLLAASPPNLIWLINMFAFGGLETAFLWVMLFGLYWRRANCMGAMLSMAGGTIVYCAAQAMKIHVFGLHPIVLGLSSSLVFFMLGAYMGKPTAAERLRVFFPDESEK